MQPAQVLRLQASAEEDGMCTDLLIACLYANEYILRNGSRILASTSQSISSNWWSTA